MSKLKDLPTRLFFHGTLSLIFVAILILIKFPFFLPIFAAIVALIAGVALWEYYFLARKKGGAPWRIGGIVFSTLVSFSLFFEDLASVVLGVALFTFFLYFVFKKNEPLVNLATTFFGVCYVTVPLALLIPIAIKGGSFWLAFVVLVTKSADMGGYFIGKSFGKTRVFKNLSPNKTLEGAVGGVVASIVVALLLAFFVSFSLWLAALLGLVLGVMGQLGDLAESLLKRDAHVKDSNALPGIGGVLDVVDSLLFTTPLIYLFLNL